MDLRFVDLRRFAIDRRVEIKIRDSNTDRVVLINTRGQARIPDENRDFSVEDVIASADDFAISGDGNPQSFNRVQMALVVQERLVSRGFSMATKDDEE